MSRCLQDRDSIHGKGREFFSSPRHVDRLWGSSSIMSSGYQGPFSGLKQQGHETDHSTPYKYRGEECVELYFHSPYVFLTSCLVKQRDNFTFNFAFKERKRQSLRKQLRSKTAIRINLWKNSGHRLSCNTT